MGEVSLNKKAYKDMIEEDIKLVMQYIPDNKFMRTHIIDVLQWSVNQLYPPEIWDKKICPDCGGDGTIVGAAIDDNGLSEIKCPKCGGTGKSIPEPPAAPPARVLREGDEPPAPPVGKGDKIRVMDIITEVQEVVYVAGQRMLRTKYGDFNSDLFGKKHE